MLEYPLEIYCSDEMRENFFKSIGRKTLKDLIDSLGNGHLEGKGNGIVEIIDGR